MGGYRPARGATVPVVRDNPWLGRRVLSFAHQGGAREGPSSTLLALRQAVEVGADALELDVHMTADGHLVVCHDATVDRTTDGTGAIAQMTLAEVQSLDNAYWWVPGEVVAPGRPEGDYPLRGRSPADPELRIATVEEVLDAFPGVFLNFDIKQTAPAVPPYEAELAALLARFGRVDDVIVGSFWDVATEAFAAAAPGVTTAVGLSGTAAFWQAVQAGEPTPPMPHAALQVPRTYQEMTIVDAHFVERAHEVGMAVHVWTVDDPEEMAALIDLGVDGIMSDVPTVLEGVLQERGVAWEGRAG